MIFLGEGSCYNVCLNLQEKLNFTFKKKAFCSSQINENFLKNYKGEKILVYSQSGETKDVIDTLTKLKNKNFYLITNTLNSTLALMTNNVFDLSAGIEIGVASTVAFTNSLFVNYLLTKKNFSKKDFFNMNLKIKKTIIKNKNTLNKLSNLNEAGFVLSNSINSFSSEASLKMSELTQNIFLSQDFNGLKHGFYSCINENETPIILDSNFSNNLLNQLISRKAITIGFNNKNLKYNLLISSKNSFEFEILKYVLIQITAFKIAIKKKLNPDKPRNLAKSITVES